MEKVKDRHEARQIWLVLLIISTAYIAVMTNIQGFKAMLPQVEEEFRISGAQAGFYSSFYFFSATLIALYSGKIVDRLGARKGLIYGVATVGCMIILHSFAPFFGVILGLAFFTGVGFSIITPSVNKGVLEKVQPGKRALSMGITHSGGGVGALLGSSLLPFLGEQFGWRTALLLAGVFALLVSLFIMKFYRDQGDLNNLSRRRHASSSADASEGAREKLTSSSSSSLSSSTTTTTTTTGSSSSPSSLKEDLRFLLKDRYLLSICISGIVFGISISSITAHLTLFLNQDLNYTPFLAGMGLFFFNLGGVFGQPGWGMVNDRWMGGNRRKGLFILGISTALVLLIFGAVVSRGVLTYNGVVLFSVLLGLFVLGIPGIYFTAISEQVPSEKTGVATSLALIFTRIGVVFFPPLFGYLSDVSGDYTISWFLLGFTVLLITLTFYLLSGRHQGQSG